MPSDPHPWLASPGLLAVTLVVPVVSGFLAYARWRRSRTMARLGSPHSTALLTRLAPWGRRGQAAAALAGLFLVGVACAGPRWGPDREQARTPGRDLVVVLDLSRSMRAEQPSRLERAIRALRDLAAALERYGGPRVALVGVAGQARLLFPLTRDYDHFRHALAQIAADDLPPLYPGPDEEVASGTRLGAALKLAVEACDPARLPRSAILLVSDGDDPAGDEEWRQGALAAREKGVPVCAIGVGDPAAGHPIPDGDDVLRHQGEAVQTRLTEAVLQEIARRTGGPYLPARTDAIPLGALLLTWLEHPASEEIDDDAPPALTPRYAWFLAPAIAFFALAMVLCDGLRRPALSAQPAPLFAVVSALLISAAPADGDAVRDGNAAFTRGDYDGALAAYGRAADQTADPGLVAFNRAAACYRLGRFREAELHYRQALEDDAAPPARRARAYYDLGNALVRQAGDADADRLRQAVRAYHRCLAEGPADADLRADARHNLATAQARWLKARAADPPPPDAEDDPPPAAPKPWPAPGTENSVDPDGDDPGSEGPSKAGDPAATGRSKLANLGSLQTLPDRDAVTPLSPDETAAHLRRIADRIRRDRQRYHQGLRPAAGTGKDW